MPYIKIKKRLYDIKIDIWNTYVFYIDDDIVDQNRHKPGFFSYMNLLALSEIVIKNDQLIKNRRLDLEEVFDNVMGL